MADREKVIKGVHDARRYLEDMEWVYKSVGVHIDALNDALALLKEQEAVVRCKDCRFWQSRVYRIIDGNTHHLCEMTKGYRKPDWFCADGERSGKANES